MSLELIVTLALLALAAIYSLLTYNGFIASRNNVKEAFATMDVYLKKRWDLIPNLVEIVKGYMSHEKDTLEKITCLRSRSYESLSSADKININEQIGLGLSKLIAVAENYPNLKANQSFLDLSAQLVRVEEDIANSRKYYNAVVKQWNNKVQMVPSNIVAGMCNFKEEKMYEVPETERETVKVKI